VGDEGVGDIVDIGLEVMPGSESDGGEWFIAAVVLVDGVSIETGGCPVMHAENNNNQNTKAPKTTLFFIVLIPTSKTVLNNLVS
jgi:hypothetical protein